MSLISEMKHNYEQLKLLNKDFNMSFFEYVRSWQEMVKLHDIFLEAMCKMDEIEYNVTTNDDPSTVVKLGLMTQEEYDRMCVLEQKILIEQ